ncbi:C40 family peptidase [Streptomyces sp. TRM 70351]|uniref:C40 family peptidase n=1 Tax=Streptomyces sp. TRM 70351 TaxID=3116552 RepID=UPI002E7AB6C6|nr:C40 family peptidase [Streptomyces sp. TRM 70351]MEE1931003.1 C40 family peptidase [Streptomyces sp. TRM 70351]
MSNAHIPSHRKPRRSSRNTLIRSGVAGGVFTTLAVTGAAAPSSASSEAPADTVEMPALDDVLTYGSAEAAHATQTIAIQYNLEAAQTEAAEQARKTAAKTKKKADAEAERKAREAAEARAKAAEEREVREAAEARAATEARASRSAERSAPAAAPAAATSEAAAPAPSTATGSAAAVVNFARAQVGKAYVMGAMGPGAYDCSGLTSVAFRQAGISLPRTSQSQSTTGTQVPLSAVQPGDILYWGGAGSAYHVAIYVGDGKFVGAQNSSTGVVERDMSWDMPTGAVRVL